jgi:two-component sensor histidine kinase
MGCDVLHPKIPFPATEFRDGTNQPALGNCLLSGEALFLPAELAVSLALIFHELATNAVKYGTFSSARGLLQVSWTLSGDRLNVFWNETEGPPVEQVGAPGFGTRLLKSALTPFEGKTDVAYLKSGIRCTIQCRIPQS